MGKIEDNAIKQLVFERAIVFQAACINTIQNGHAAFGQCLKMSCHTFRILFDKHLFRVETCCDQIFRRFRKCGDEKGV
jgi:hypothetical protein